MADKRLGAQTVALPGRPAIVSWASVGGRLEGEGPLGRSFDEISQDHFWGEATWERGESTMQRRALSRALEKASLTASRLDLVFGGDLLDQCTATSFALRPTDLPFCGLYNACATMGEALLLAAMAVEGGFARRCAALASSHFCTAERQYRMPVPYGSQRTPTAQWTVTASGCCILARGGSGVRVTHLTTGRIVDAGVKDATNMGAAMAPAAHDTLRALLRDTGTAPEDYDLIVTGDLGHLGHALLRELFARDGVALGAGCDDCGRLIFERKRQDMHCGGSGAGCSAAVLCAHILPGLRGGTWRRVIFAPTGALLSPTSSFQGESIPGICHALVLEAE